MAAPILAVSDLLPGWVGWLNLLLWPLVGTCVALLVTFVSAQVALGVGNAPGGENWAEEVARAWPVHQTLKLVVMFAIIVPMILGVDSHGPVSFLPIGAHVAVIGCAAMIGTLPIIRDVARRLGDLKPRRRFRNLIVGLTLFWPNLVLIIMLLLFLPWEWNLTSLFMLAAAAISGWAAALGEGIWVLRLLGIARPGSPRLESITKATSERVGVTPSSTWEIDCGIPNAFVFPLSKRLCFTTRSLEVLTDEEARAICAHELGHLQESTLVKQLRLASVMIPIALGAAPAIAMSAGRNALGTLLIIVIVTLAMSLRIRQRMETRADNVAHKHESQHGTYAAALEKLYKDARIPMVVAGRAQAHNNLYDRMTAAGAQPAYERPPPPRRWPMVAGVIAGVVTLVVLNMATIVSFQIAAFQGRSVKSGRLFEIALRGGRAADFGHLAGLHLATEEINEAIRLYGVAAELDLNSVHYPAQRALLLAIEHRCEEATETLSDAWMRSPENGPVDGLLEISAQAVQGNCSAVSEPLKN